MALCSPGAASTLCVDSALSRTAVVSPYTLSHLGVVSLSRMRNAQLLRNHYEKVFEYDRDGT
jgi:hypothetical protein